MAWKKGRTDTPSVHGNIDGGSDIVGFGQN